MIVLSCSTVPVLSSPIKSTANKHTQNIKKTQTHKTNLNKFTQVKTNKAKISKKKSLVKFVKVVKKSKNVKQPSIKHVFFKENFYSNKLNAHLIIVDLNNPSVSLDIVLAHNNTSKKETVYQMAKRVGAVAAINGSFFHSKYSINSPVGIVMSNGVVLSDSGHRRTSIGIAKNNRVIIGIPKIENFVQMPEIGISMKLSGINQMRRRNNTILYTNYFGARTKTKGSGREILVNEYGTIIDYKMNNSIIPKRGFVISIAGAGSDIADKYPIGTLAYMESIKVSPWDNVDTILTGSPQLIKHGKVYNTYYQENLQKSLIYPATRTAVGITHNNKLLMLTVTGKLTFTKLAKIMKRLGAIDALALDGGSSTSMYLNGKKLVTCQRPVTNALVVKIKPKKKFFIF